MVTHQQGLCFYIISSIVLSAELWSAPWVQMQILATDSLSGLPCSAPRWSAACAAAPAQDAGGVWRHPWGLRLQMGTTAWARARPSGSLVRPAFFPTLAKSGILQVTAWGDCTRPPATRRRLLRLSPLHRYRRAWSSTRADRCRLRALRCGYFLRLFSFSRQVCCSDTSSSVSFLLLNPCMFLH